MYIYQVTHIPTKRFYLGFEELTIRESNLNTDPMNVFPDQAKGFNGVATLDNLFKQIISKVGSKDEARSQLADMAKHNADNPDFLGIKMKAQVAKPEPTSNVEDSKENSTKRITK